MAADEHPGEPGRDQAPAEKIRRAIESIPGIVGVELVFEGDYLREIHVEYVGPKEEKQVARNVRSILKSRLKIEIDHRYIEVVKTGEGSEDGGGAGDSDPKVGRVTTTSDHATTTVNVELEFPDGQRSGSARGPVTSTWRLVVQAVLEAVDHSFGTGLVIEVEAVDVVPQGGRQLATVVLRAVGRGEQLRVGSDIGRGDANRLVASATLSALGRLDPSI